MIAQVDINQKSDGTWSLLIDGKELADEVCGAVIQITGVGKPAQVRLEFVDLRTFTGTADVVVDDRLAAILTRMGWTPPDGDLITTHALGIALANMEWLMRDRPEVTAVHRDSETVIDSESGGVHITALTEPGYTPATDGA